MTNKISTLKNMISHMVFAGAACGLLAAVPAQAQIAELPAYTEAASAKPADESLQLLTDPSIVAMIFHKLSSTPPEFNTWAMNTDAYLKASPLEKGMALESEIARMKSMFTLTTLSEPIVVQKQVELTPYSFRNKGFTIESLNDDVYFPFTYGGINYAVIIPTLSNYQWVPIEGDAAGILEQTAEKNHRNMLVTISVTPEFADAKNKMTLDGKDFWLISGQIKRLVISAPDSGKVLWEKSAAVADDSSTPQQELLDLYKK